MLKRIALPVLLSLGLGFTAAAPAETPKDVLVSAWTFDDIITMDPGNMFEISTFEITGNVYDALVAFSLDDTSKIHGVLAESWTVGDDGRTYTFKIRDGVKFHSGRPLTARDVEYSFRRLVLMDGSPAFLLTDLGPSKDNVEQTIKALDDRTFQLVVGDDYAPSYVLNVLTAGNFAVVDSEEVKSHEVNGDMGAEWLKTNSAGSGPFVLRSWKANESVTIDRFDGYWAGPAKLKRIVWRHIPEAATQRLLLEQGDIDIARSLPADQLDPLKSNADIAITATPQGTSYYLGLNVKNEHFA
ncbi:MAG: ABC transporter substrate-binding protein, partial [Planctomycetes bacterium]|nr:ABC transporter substrate-binding protein [Planctomycetota bacterium]